MLTPDNSDDFVNNPLFQDADGNYHGYATVGDQAGGELSSWKAFWYDIFGSLVTEINYPGNAPSSLKNMKTVATPKGMSDTEFINIILNTAQIYKNNAVYNPLPSPQIGLVGTYEWICGL